jgi:hypothetical protein
MGGLFMPNGGIENVTVEGFPGAGLTVPEGGDVNSRKLKLKRNGIALDNSGRFNGPDTEIE